MPRDPKEAFLGPAPPPAPPTPGDESALVTTLRPDQLAAMQTPEKLVLGALRGGPRDGQSLEFSKRG